MKKFILFSCATFFLSHNTLTEIEKNKENILTQFVEKEKSKYCKDILLVLFAEHRKVLEEIRELEKYSTINTTQIAARTKLLEAIIQCMRYSLS